MALSTHFFIEVFCLILVGCPATSPKGGASYRDRVNHKARVEDYASDNYNHVSRYGSPRNRTVQYPDYSFYGARTPYHNNSNTRKSDRYDRTHGYLNRERNSAYFYKNLSYSRNYYKDDDEDDGDTYTRGKYKTKSDDYGPVRNLYNVPLYPYYKNDTSSMTCPKCPDCPPACPTSTTAAATSRPDPDDDAESTSSTPPPGSTDTESPVSLPSGCELQPFSNNVCYAQKQTTPFRCTLEECAETSRVNPQTGVKIFPPDQLTVSRCAFRKADYFLFNYDVCQVLKPQPSQYFDLSRDHIKSFVCGGFDRDCFEARKTVVIVKNLIKCGSSISSSLTPITLQCTIKLTGDNSNVLDSASINITVVPDCRC